MRVLHIIQRYYPYVGGSEGYFKEISERLVLDGHSVDVFTTDAWDIEHFWAKGKKRVDKAEEWVNGVHVRRFPVRHVPVSRLVYPVQRRIMAEISSLPLNMAPLLSFMCQSMPLVPGLTRALAAGRGCYDIVHATNVPFDSLLYAASRVTKAWGVPMLITPFTHLGEPGNIKVRRYYSMQHQIASLCASKAVIVQTELEKDFLAAKGVPLSLLRKVGVGLNPWEVEGGVAERFRQSHGIHGPLVFTLGTMAYEKGTQHTIDAMRLLWRKGVAVDLVLAGPVMSHIERYVEDLPPEEKKHCHLLGFVDNEVKRDLLAAGDVFVMPSRTDSFGIVYLEAWLYGKPVIGARAGGVPEVIDDDVDGYLVPFGDAEQIASRTRQLLDDKAVAARFGAAGRQKVLSQHTWDKKYDALLNIYREFAVSD
ncbi:MAG: glycosyltransferase family 4 protein [Chloroflexi bacterium]|nr:glycosyltransferase family 4 protein [Chloroflexota bacterium]